VASGRVFHCRSHEVPAMTRKTLAHFGDVHPGASSNWGAWCLWTRMAGRDARGHQCGE